MFVCIYCRRFLTLPSRWLLSRVFQMLRYAWNYCCCWSNWPHCALSRSALGEHIIYHQLSVICYLLSVFSIRNHNCCYHNHIACVQLSWILSGMVVYGYAKKKLVASWEILLNHLDMKAVFHLTFFDYSSGSYSIVFYSIVLCFLFLLLFLLLWIIL